jgi:hypothetical protein
MAPLNVRGCISWVCGLGWLLRGGGVYQPTNFRERTVGAELYVITAD